jgi:hypothetical protein
VAASGRAADRPGLGQVVWLPVVEWVLGVLGWAWPWLGRTPRYQDLRTLVHAAYLVSVAGLGLAVTLRWVCQRPAGWLLGRVVCQRDGSQVELEAVPGLEGRTTSRARLSGEFVIEATPHDEFEKRWFILTLRHASRRTPGRERSSWGLVRQEDLAQVLGVTPEEISRGQRYVRAGQWAQVLSLQEKSLLTDDVRQQIVEVWAVNLWQTAAQVGERLTQQGVAVTERLVQEAGRQSGLMKIRARLKDQFISGPERLRSRDGYMTEQLFKRGEQLQAGQAAPREDTVEVMALRQIAGVPEPENCLVRSMPWPWLFQVEHGLFGEWQLVDDRTVRCPHCGTAAASTWPSRANSHASKPIWTSRGNARPSRGIAITANTPTAPSRPLRIFRRA